MTDQQPIPFVTVRSPIAANADPETSHLAAAEITESGLRDPAGRPGLRCGAALARQDQPRRRDFGIRACERCTGRYIARRLNQRYCSPECRKAAWEQVNRPRLGLGARRKPAEVLAALRLFVEELERVFCEPDEQERADD